MKLDARAFTPRESRCAWQSVVELTVALYGRLSDKLVRKNQEMVEAYRILERRVLLRRLAVDGVKVRSDNAREQRVCFEEHDHFEIAFGLDHRMRRNSKG